MKRAVILLVLFPAAGLVSPAAADTAEGAIQGWVWQRGDKLLVQLTAGEQTVDGVRIDPALGSPAVIWPPGWRLESQPFGVLGMPSSQVVVGFDLPPSTRVPGKLRIEALSGADTVYKEKVEIVDSPRPQPVDDPADRVSVPPLVTPGGPLLVDAAAPGGGQGGLLPELVTGVNLTWRGGEDLGTLPLVPADPERPWGSGFTGRLPETVSPGTVIEIQLQDAFGDTISEGPLSNLQVLPPTTWPQSAVVIAVSDKAVVGNTLCVSGYVPDVLGWSRLQLGGNPLGPPRYASSLVAGFDVRDLVPKRYLLGRLSTSEEPLEIEEDLGLWRPAGDAPADEPSEEGGGLWTEIIEIDAGIRQETIRTGQKTVVYFNVLGTRDPMPFDLELISKGVGKLEGGNRQTATTSGGEKNGFEREVEGLKPGEFNINWLTEAGNCPGTGPPPTASGGPADTEPQPGLNPDLEELYATLFLKLLEENREVKLEPPSPPYEPQDPCLPAATSLCLNDERFRVKVEWATEPEAGKPGLAVRPDDTGLFFFDSDPDSDNWELMLKVLNGCRFNDHYWVFFGATTDVEYTVTVTDTQSGAERAYQNPLGQPANAVVDTDAFATCP